jgi:Leucine-rich repeat (LRR) protein
MNKYFHILVFLLISTASVFAQTSDDGFQDVPVYTDLKAAMKNPMAVRRFSFVKMNISRIPPEIFELENLEELDLSKNKIKKIPPEIKHLKKLKILNLSKNQLEELPAELGELEQLEKLDVSRNNIYKLPETIGNCSALEILLAWDTNLTGLPETLTKLKNLKEIDLRVILFSDTQKQYLSDLLPKVTIHFSGGCNCGPY